MTAANPRPIVSATDWMAAFRAADKRSLKASAVAVAWVLHSYANWTDGSGIYPSTATIGTGAGIGRDTAGEALKELAALGWIDVVSGSGKGVVRTHRLTVPDMWGKPAPHVGISHRGWRNRPHNPSVDPVVTPQPIDSALYVVTGASADPWDELYAEPEPQHTDPTAQTGSRRVGTY